MYVAGMYSQELKETDPGAYNSHRDALRPHTESRLRTGPSVCLALVWSLCLCCPANYDACLLTLGVVPVKHCACPCSMHSPVDHVWS